MILAFDGACVLCNGFVRFLLPRDRRRRLLFASSASEVGRALFDRTGQDPAEPLSVVLADGDRLYLDSEAILRAVAALGGGWRLVAALRLIPRVLRDRSYRIVARNRYRWFGRHGDCPVPDRAFADRFAR